MCHLSSVTNGTTGSNGAEGEKVIWRKRPLFEVQTMVVSLSYNGSLLSKQWLFTPLNKHRLQVKRVSF